MFIGYVVARGRSKGAQDQVDKLLWQLENEKANAESASLNFQKQLENAKAEAKELVNNIKADCEKLGVPSELETFKVDGCDIKKASVKFFEPEIEVECAGVGMSSSTSEDGITGEFVYVTNIIDAEIQNTIL